MVLASQDRGVAYGDTRIVFSRISYPESTESGSSEAFSYEERQNRITGLCCILGGMRASQSTIVGKAAPFVVCN